MKRALIAATLFLLMMTIALPAEAGFRSLANEIGMQEDLKRVWIPFFGIGRMIVKVAHPDGIHDVKLAVFEDRGGADLVDLEVLVGRHLDLEDWSPLIHARSKAEDAHVFVQDRGENVGIFIAARDGSEIVVLEVELDADRFAQEMEGDGDFISLGRGE